MKIMIRPIAASILFAASMTTYAGFPVVYDPARGTPSQTDVSIPIKVNGKERCGDAGKWKKIKMLGEIELSAFAVPKLTGTNARNGLDIHEQTPGVGARVTVNGRTNAYDHTFAGSGGATIEAGKRRVTDYFGSVLTDDYDKLYGTVIYDYPGAKTTAAKFAIPGVINYPALRPDTYHYLSGRLWLTSQNGQCQMRGNFKQRK